MELYNFKEYDVWQSSLIEMNCTAIPTKDKTNKLGRFWLAKNTKGETVGYFHVNTGGAIHDDVSSITRAPK